MSEENWERAKGLMGDTKFGNPSQALQNTAPISATSDISKDTGNEKFKKFAIDKFSEKNPQGVKFNSQLVKIRDGQIHGFF